MHLLLLLFSYPHLYSKITKGSVYVKMDRSEEKQQALEKLLSSDVYPPIHYTVEEQTAFFGGGDQKVSSINYSILELIQNIKLKLVKDMNTQLQLIFLNYLI